MLKQGGGMVVASPPSPALDRDLGGPCIRAEDAHQYAEAARVCERLGDTMWAEARASKVLPQRVSLEHNASDMYLIEAVDNLEVDIRNSKLTRAQRAQGMTYSMKMLRKSATVVRECAAARVSDFDRKQVKNLDEISSLLESCKFDIKRAKGQRGIFLRDQERFLEGKRRTKDTTPPPS
jgi:hypothetical protein